MWTNGRPSFSYPTTTGALTIGSKPGMRPFSGEPDIGQSKVPPNGMARPSRIISAGPGLNLPASAWIQWIGRIWMARYLGG